MTAALSYNTENVFTSESSYLLFIDENPVDEYLKNYFNQFNINIVEQNTLTSIPHKQGILAAILIHCSILKNELPAIEQLYKTHLVPLLVISDHPNEMLCIKVLETGADDFIIKPIYPRELHARINAINRRVLSTPKQSKQENEIWRFTNWRLHATSRQVFNHLTNQELELSAGEYDLLLFFIQEPQRVLNRDYFLSAPNKSNFNPLNRRIDVQISRLRQKIEVDPKKPKLIKTIRNGGYMFTAQVTSTKEYIAV